MTEPTIKRVLVALDPCRESLVALDSALALAAQRQAELLALFIEDESLLHLAALPFARELNPISGTERRLDTLQMHRAFRAQAEQIRQTVERSAAALKIQASVKVVRGHFFNEVLAHAVATDVLFFARAGGQSHPHRFSGKKTIVQPVWVVFDGSETAVRALSIAAELCGANELFVLLAKNNSSLRQQAVALLSRHQSPIRYFEIESQQLTALLAMINRAGCRLLVIPKNSPLLDHETAQNLLDKIDCPVVTME